MADLNISCAYSLSKDNLTNSASVSGATASMANSGFQSNTLSLSGTAVGISTANLTNVGVAFIQNLSTSTAATAAIGVLSGGTFVPFANLRAGEPAVLRLVAGSTYQATGTSGTRLRIDITEG
jgi:hypothetical protein